jgi:hypothetical protein
VKFASRRLLRRRKRLRTTQAADTTRIFNTGDQVVSRNAGFTTALQQPLVFERFTSSYENVYVPRHQPSGAGERVKNA